MFRKGLDVKNIVDDTIDQCDVFYNLRDSIEESRIRAEQATDEKQKKLHTQKGEFRSENCSEYMLTSIVLEPYIT